ncbi:MAG: Shikimate kinase [Herbinix sp.]|jgi:shikimate kinase|nr:Shikimate kinase [Herbinix sp.]
MKHNIILIGFMGSGKTCVGEYLAKQLSYGFQDSDQLIEEKTRDSINHIFSRYGEEYFRNLETDLLKEMVPVLEKTVLSTGGGLPIRDENAAILKELGFVVFLKTSKETTINRLQGDSSRPLLQGDELEEKVERMLALRTPIYENTAHDVIVTDGRTVEEITELIMEAYKNIKN